MRLDEFNQTIGPKSIRRNPSLIRYVAAPTKEMQMIAVNEDPETIKFIENPVESAQIIVVKKDPLLIRFIENPTEKVQLIACNKNPKAKIYIKNPSPKIRMDEALKPSEYREYVKGWNRKRYDKIFKNPKYEHDRKGYRVFLPIENVDEDIEAPTSVSQELDNKGYYIYDYKKGIAAKKDNPNRKIRMGKLLSPNTRNEFVNDPNRGGTQNEYEVVISRHPYDLAGMSTNRGWDSCMNLDEGSKRKFVAIDIKEGSVIAYLVKKGDRNIQNPVGRVMIKPFMEIVNSNFTKNIFFGIENKIYGSNSPGFLETVEKWADEINFNKVLNNVVAVMKNRKVHNDGQNKGKKTIIIKDPNKLTPDEIFKYFTDAYIIKTEKKLDASKFDDELILNIARWNPSSFAYIENFSEELTGKLIDWAATMIRFMSDISERMQLKAVSKTGDVIAHIKNPSEKIQMAAVKEYPGAIKYIRNPTINVLRYVLENDPEKLRYVEQLPENIQIEMIQKNPKFIKFIQNPAERIKVES